MDVHDMYYKHFPHDCDFTYITRSRTNVLFWFYVLNLWLYYSCFNFVLKIIIPDDKEANTWRYKYN